VRQVNAADSFIKESNWLRLYKYRSLEGPYGFANIEDIILNNRMRWQSPLDFNDPFDCLPYTTFGTNKLERQRYIHDLVNRKMPDAPRAARRTRERELNRRTPSEVAEEQNQYFRELMAGSAVTCFSEDPLSILMWAHYADQHRGICFEFQEQLAGRFVGLPVVYTNERPVSDTTRLQHVDTLKALVLTKSSHWAYEKEHRMISYREKAGVRSFPPESLKSVILGARISLKHEAEIRSLVAARHVPIAITRVELSETKYELQIGHADGPR
jgi:hypothetical protein